VDGPGQRQSISAASAVNAKGAFWYCTYSGADSSQKYTSPPDAFACRAMAGYVSRCQSLNCFRIALVSALQRLLWGQPELGQQFAYGRHAKPNVKLALDETGHH
jgi:hypothetical protein